MFGTALRPPGAHVRPLSRPHRRLAAHALAGLVAATACSSATPAAPTAAPAANPPASTAASPASAPAAASPATSAASPSPAAAAAPAAPSASGSGKTLRFVWVGDLNPLWYPSQWETFGQAVIFSLIYNNLVKLDEDLKTIVPDIAEKYEVSPDATQFTFTLRQGVKWQDGAPFTTKDVVFSFSRQLLTENKIASHMLALKGADEYKAGTADHVAGIEELDANTIRLTLKQPDATFLFNLREPGNVLVPEHLLKDVKPEAMKDHPFTLRAPVGTGPYKFVQYVTDQYVELDANPDYFKGRPKIDKIFMKRLNPEVTIAQLESGEVDLALRLNPVEYERLSKVPTLNVISRPGVGQTSMLFATEQPHLKDKRIRQGIYYAIDRKAIGEAVFQGRLKILNGAPPALDVFPGLNPYDYSPDKAKQLLTDGGWDFKRPVRIIYDQLYPAANQYYPLIAQQLQKIGLTVELNALDTAAYTNRLQNERTTWELAGSHGGNQGLGPWLSSIYFDCKRVGFNSGYQNCDLDALFAKANSLSDQAQRDAVYTEIAKLLNEDVPQIFLWTPNDLHAASKRLGGGFSVYGDPRSSFGKVETWTID